MHCDDVGNSWGHKHREVGWKDKEEWGVMENGVAAMGGWPTSIFLSFCIVFFSSPPLNSFFG